MNRESEVVVMALPIRVDRLLRGCVVESTRIELKSAFNPNPIMHTIFSPN